MSVRTAPNISVSRPALNNFSKLLEATKRMAEAEPMMARVVRILRQFERATGHEHSHMQDAIESYRSISTRLNLETPRSQRGKGGEGGNRKAVADRPEMDRLRAQLNRSRRC